MPAGGDLASRRGEDCPVRSQRSSVNLRKLPSTLAFDMPRREGGVAVDRQDLARALKSGDKQAAKAERAEIAKDKRKLQADRRELARDKQAREHDRKDLRHVFF